ncbi:gluconate:H+ symporter [Pseudonocardia sp. NPDC046786]|uniref:GntT/GntP/DsdX family permease n=1 Tax=Pseudonocardia sp. NPDC046786 TaxID=3155471 RepID=UPI0033ECEA63
MSVVALIGIAVAAVALLLALIIWLKVPAFLALLIVAVATALAGGMAPADIMPTVIEGMGSTLGNVALLVGLGAMLGAVVEKTGGARILAERFTRRLGPERVGPALLVVSSIVVIPIFFDVAYIILLPILFSFAKAAGQVSPVIVGIPVGGIMALIHGLVPPHPGITGGATLLDADVGLVVLVGLGVCVPLGVQAYYVGRLMFARREFRVDTDVQRRFDGSAGAAPVRPDDDPAGDSADLTADTTADTGRDGGPGPFTVAAMILVPVVLIAIGTVSELVLAKGSTLHGVTSLAGAPAFALLFAVVLSSLVLGVRHGWSMDRLGSLMNAALAPAAIVVFVTGAGGVFAEVLSESGIGDSVSGVLVESGVPVLLLAFLLATIFRVAQGSATVATLAAAGLVQSTVAAGDFTNLQVVLIVLAIGCGASSLSHVNDSGFWIVTRFLGLSVADGLRTWTVMMTVLSWTGMLLVSGLWLIVS